MIETTDLKVIEAIDNIRNTVGDIFEEDQLYSLKGSVNAVLDVVEAAAVIKMLVVVMRSFDGEHNYGEEWADLINALMDEAGIGTLRLSYSPSMGQQNEDAKAEDQDMAAEAKKEDIRDEDTRKRVVLYTPEVTSNTITDTETFHFDICQEVPYERDAAYYYSAFVMKDTVPTGLKVTSVKILNEAGGNATGKFNVTTSGQTVTATAIDTSAGSFYNQEYTMQIFCKYDKIKLRHPCNMYQTDICFDQKQRFCQGKRGVDMKKAAILILRFIMVPFRLVIHVMAAIAWLAVRLSSIIAGPVIALLGVLAVFCAAHQEWRNVVILLILGGAIYVAYFLAGNVIARAESI